VNRSSLISAAEDVLRQGLALLDSVDDASYSRKEEGPWGSSIGAHYRHVLDHFLCPLEGLSRSQIDYDRRGRNRDIESSVQAARLATHKLIEELLALPNDALHRDCTVAYSVNYGDCDAQSVPSTVARELMFCVGHAIHHYAIMKLLCSQRAVGLHNKFGLAPSTLKYQQVQAAS
jgi:hypothetical protein